MRGGRGGEEGWEEGGREGREKGREGEWGDLLQGLRGG